MSFTPPDEPDRVSVAFTIRVEDCRAAHKELVADALRRGAPLRVTARAEGELGDDEPAQHVGGPAGAEAQLGERGQERPTDGGESLVGENLDLGRVAEVVHVGPAVS